MIVMASNITREELKAQTRFAFFERKLQTDGEGQTREEVRALVRYPWGGRQVRGNVVATLSL